MARDGGGATPAPVYGGADRVPNPNPQPYGGPGNPFLNQMLGGLGINSNVGASSGAGQINDFSPVFTGWNQYKTGPSGTGTGVSGPKTRTIADIMKEVYGTWTREKIGQVGQQFVNAGWIQQADANNLAVVAAQYQKLLELAAAKTAAGSYVTPEELLNGWVGGGGGQARPSSYTNSITSTDLTNPGTARQLLRQSLQDRLGRDPSAAEQQAFMAARHQAETNDPTVRTSTYKLDPATGQYNETAATTKGGVDASAYSTDYGRNHNEKEAGAYQAAAVFFPALMQAVRAAV